MWPPVGRQSARTWWSCVAAPVALLTLGACASDKHAQLRQRFEQVTLYDHAVCRDTSAQQPGAAQPALRLRPPGPGQAARTYCTGQIGPQMAGIAELALRQAGRHGPASAERIELLSLAADAGLGSNGDAKALAAGQSAAELGEQACGGGAGGANGQPAPAGLADGCAKLRLMRPILAHGQWVEKLAPLVRSWQQTKVIPRDPASRSMAAEAARRYFPEVATPAIAAYRTASAGPALSPQASDFARDWLQQMRCATMVIQALNIGEPGLRDEVGGMVRQFPAELRQPGCGPAA